MNGTTAPSGPIEVRSDAESSTWRKAIAHGFLAYVMSRLAVFVGAAIVAAELRADDNRIRERFIWGPIMRADPHARSLAMPRSATSMILDVLTSWDGIWYMRIVRFGYPSFVPPHITYDDTQARVAFFPAFPYLVKIVDRVLPGGDTFAALFTNVALGALFVLLVGVLARAWFGATHARTAMVLIAIFPGSFVLSFAYSEALLLCLAALCLVCIHEEKWLMAGLSALLATASRPNGIAVAAACLVAAVVASRRHRSWRPMIAPLLAPFGLLGFQFLIDWHTGESGVWFRVQGQAWDEGASFGLTALRRSVEAFTQPLTSPTDLITAAAFAATIVLVVIAWRSRRLPVEAAAYSTIILALMLLPSTVTARPRFLFTAFPLLIAAAAWLDEPRRKEWWPYVVGICFAGLTALTAVYGVYAAIP